ncbi:MAG TPA: hypothetical protein VGO47_05415, partial [Chlamydiales bacterium]|nr:hypothetical protein [Chlamydiales bacterium]
LIEEKEVGKTITTYLLYQESAHLHRSEWKIEKDWEGNLIHKTHYAYDSFGHLTKELHYGSDDALPYRTTKLYDSHDNLLEETNPLGQIASYTYDDRGRQIQEIPFSQNKAIQRTFDGKGRLTTLQESNHTTRFFYNSDDLLKRPGWTETTHPEAGKKGHRTFENGKTGEKLRHDEGKPWETGHKAHDHYHRPNPNATGRHNEYLDGKGNPTRDQSDPSHIYPPEGIWWN